MIRNVAIEILNLIENNNGLNISEIIKPSIDIQKIIDIILSECRCSIIDKNGNYARFGSSTDIRVIKILIQIFLSNSKEIPPEVVSMALTKEGVIGPLKKIGLQKKYIKKEQFCEIEMEEVFPNEFNVNIFEKNLEIKNTTNLNQPIHLFFIILNLLPLRGINHPFSINSRTPLLWELSLIPMVFCKS